MKSLPPLVAFVAAMCLVSAYGAEKPRITSQDQLPRFEYAYAGKVTDIATREEVYRQIAPKVRADLENLLVGYDIVDTTTRRGIQDVLLSMDVHDGRFDSALERLAIIRELEKKPAARLTAGLLAESYIAARKATAGDAAALRAKFHEIYAAKVAALPWDIVSDDLQETKANAEVVTEALIVGSLSSQFQPGVDKTGKLSGEVARALVGARTAIAHWLPLRDERVAVLAAYVKAHKEIKPDIWAERSVTLDDSAGLHPVHVAVWDSGVDMPIFKGQQWINPAEKADGADTDGNGFVDDVHGIAFSLHADRTPELLIPLEPAQVSRYPVMRDLTKGVLDLQAGIDSDAATALKQRMGAMRPEEVQPFLEDLGLFGNYTHGTHVAGITAAGNPAVRLMAVRITFDHHLVPECPTREVTLKEAAAFRDAVAYMKSHGVRVVNMSWGGSPRDIEAALEANGAGGTTEERRAFARELFEIGRDALTEAIRSAPEILFVAAAGNSDSDAAFDESIPSAIELPNILTVGAVDQAGEETSFSSFGANVDVHANGYEVDSVLPGGERMKYSGTSMAAPNVTNLAAKLLAIDPSLTTEQIVAIIKLGAERSADGRINLINPKRSLAILKARGGV